MKIRLMALGKNLPDNLQAIHHFPKVTCLLVKRHLVSEAEEQVNHGSFQGCNVSVCNEDVYVIQSIWFATSCTLYYRLE